MNPQQRTLNLTVQQQELFARHEYLIPWVYRQLRHHWHPNDHDELLQRARLGLVHAVQVATKKGITDFRAFAHYVIKQECMNRKGRARGIQQNGSGDNGRVSQQNAKVKERSLSDVLGSTEDGEYTRLNQLEDNRGKAEVQRLPGEDRLAARLFEIRQALQTLDTLTQFEKRVLKLKFIDGLRRHEIARRLDSSVTTVRWAIHGAVVKLRVHFHGWGALDPDAPLPAAGGNKD